MKKALLLTVLVVAISGCAQRSDPAPVEAVYSGRTIYDFTRGSLSDTAYQVQSGDTLYSIAFRAEMDLRDIARLNSLQEPYEIFPGQVLRLTGNSTENPVISPVSTTNRTINAQNSVKERKDSKESDLTPPIASKPIQEYVENPTVEQARPSSLPAPRPPIQNAQSSALEWQWPSQGRIVQRFSTSRPGANGLIFAGTRGDPVTAAAAGKVVYAGSALRGFGRLIILQHNDDYITAYAHNERLLVEEQQWVSAGQQIATMGDSDTDTVRLRFELRYQGSSVNPEQHLPRSR